MTEKGAKMEEANKMKVKIKPVYNFQSIEIEFDVFSTQEIIDFIKFDYLDILSELKTSTDAIIKPIENQPKQVVKQKPVELATPKQKEIMEQYGIEFDDNISKADAVRLIKASIEACK